MQCCYLIIYLIFSDVYLWCQKFSFQTHRHWKSTSSVFTRFTTAVLITELKYRYLYYTYVYSLVIVISEFRTLLDCRQNFIYIRIFNFHRPRKRQTCRHGNGLLISKIRYKDGFENQFWFHIIKCIKLSKLN